MNNFSNF